MKARLATLARLLGLPSLDGDGTTLSGVAIDSRAVRPGDLFVALRGERVDGHGFVDDAARRGAAAALVAHRLDHTLPQLVVADPLAGLQRIATAERAAATYRLVGVTGSIAKTTTKELLAALLATTYSTGATRGSRNSQAGFPAELCNQPEGLEWMVAELGMSHAGELDRLGAVAQPDALLYTVIAPVHLEFFCDIEGIAEAKAELIPHLRRDGLLVLNAADPRVRRLKARFPGRVLSYGVAGDSDLWIDRYHGHDLLGAELTLRGPDAEIAIEWRMAGRHQATNLLAAAACALALGVPGERIREAAASAHPAPHRGEVLQAASGITVVDDSYNASPVATREMLALLASTPGRRVAVLGEMLELGERSTEFHREIGEQASGAADIVIAVGGAPAAALAAAADGIEAHHVADAAAALALLATVLREGDVVLVKGSRGIALDRVVAGLVEGAR